MDAVPIGRPARDALAARKAGAKRSMHPPMLLKSERWSVAAVMDPTAIATGVVSVRIYIHNNRRWFWGCLNLSSFGT